MNDRQPMRVLVAGATGSLGRALIPVLHGRGREVVAVVRPGSQSRLNSFLNLLRAAERSGVGRFVYLSVIGADRDVRVPVIRAKRRFENALIESPLQWQIVRPSGFFTDMTDVLKMAAQGTVHLFGDGRSRITPIDPVDLAETVADLLEGEPGQIRSVGGPADYTWNEIADLACRVAGKSCTIRHWPEWLLRAALGITRVLSPPTHGTPSFLGYVMTHDTTAPNHGSRNLEDFFRAQQEVQVP